MENMLTIDLEDYYQLVYRNKLGKQTPPSDQVAELTLRILHILGDFDAKATFFVLGTIAEHFPELVEKIAREGHEVATHGHSHDHVAGMTSEEFSRELSLSLSILRDIAGQKVVGHRAPYFSMKANWSWAFDVMADHGITYDSSLIPTNRGHNGQFWASQAPYEFRPNLIEVPVSALKFGNARFILGGTYFRLCPYGFSRWFVKRLNRAGLPAVIYFHPYEFDTAPKLFDLDGASAKDRLEVSRINLQYRINCSQTEKKLRALLCDFGFTSVLDGLKGLGLKV